ncbi:MAG TPA: glycine zipper 2TM domain-containing protein [Nevskia sp.]|nr:glycine zipper 2TM domain-containing protein [Nevskia sp.]
MNKQGLGRFLVAAAALGVSTAALADPYYGGGYYGPPPGEAYAEVLNSTPVYQQVNVAIPRQQCYDQQVVYNDYRPSLGGTLIGGLAGGLLGHSIGGGSGKAWATGIGAVVGAGIGNNIANANYGAQRVGYQRQCATVNDYQVQQQLAGYDVTYRYGGQVYRTHLPYDPGQQLLVRVNVAPAGY